MSGADAALVEGWLRARSLARGLPQPVPVGTGWRVETGSDHELRRFVFPWVCDEVRQIAATLSDSRVLLKVAASEAEVRRYVPPQIEAAAYGLLMVRRGAVPDQAALENGFRLSVTNAAGVIACDIRTPDGTLAASGFAAEYAGAFCYDRIVTEEAFRRRGLARQIIKALGRERRSVHSVEVLVATTIGARLYAALGWGSVSQWTTAARRLT